MVKDAMIHPDVAREPWQEAAVFIRSGVTTTAGSPERFHRGFRYELQAWLLKTRVKKKFKYQWETSGEGYMSSGSQ